MINDDIVSCDEYDNECFSRYTNGASDMKYTTISSM